MVDTDNVNCSRHHIADEVRRAVADASACYEITFAPPVAEHPHEHHAVEVKLSQPGLTGICRIIFY